MALAVAFGLFTCFADVPVTINYVGHIEGGSVTSDQKVMLMVFRLYDRPGRGRNLEKMTALWGRESSVALSDGDFDVDLKDTFGSVVENTQYVSLAEAIAAAQKNGASDLYLGLTPASDQNAEIYPRQRLTAIPKVMLARSVRGVPDDFSSLNGTFVTEGELRVVGSSQMKGDASYGAANFGPTATTSFKAGVDVSGALLAESVSATALKAETVAATTADTGASGTLSVSGAMSAVGKTEWNGNLKGVQTAAVTRVEGVIDTATVEARTLVASNFVNNSSSTPIYQHKGDWKFTAAWKQADAPEEIAEQYNMNIYDPRRQTTISSMSISTGSWQAPCDCLALFQTYVYNRKETDPACVQFYIITDPNFNAFNAVEPNAVAMVSNGKGSTLEYAVPLLLRKGQLVKWLCYNNNASDNFDIKETQDTKVTAINYQKFGWSAGE